MNTETGFKNISDQLYEELAIEIEHHLKQYVPRGWKEKISVVDFVPHFLNEEAEKIFEAWLEGDLDEVLKDKKWYIQDGIKDFFDAPIIGFKRCPILVEVKHDSKI